MDLPLGEIESYEDFYKRMAREAARSGPFNFFKAHLEKLDTEEKRKENYAGYVARRQKTQNDLRKAFAEDR